MPTFRDAVKFVSTCTDLDELKMLMEMAHNRRAALGKVNASSFRPGDRVKFRNRDGVYVHGTFNRRLTKNVEVKVAGGGTWRVSPQLIERDESI